MRFRPQILLLSTAYLPPVEYMAWLTLAERAEIEIHETYAKQTWRNRCSIFTANGPLALSIPVEKPLGNHTPTGLVKISKHQPWQKQHWRSIASAYSKSAFFLYYRDFLEPLYHNEPPENLVDWNRLVMETLLDAIGFSIPINFTAGFEKEVKGKNDLRQIISPKVGNKGLIDPKSFPKYFQPFSDRHGFIPNQSIIDLLFNLGPDSLDYLQQCAKEQIDQFSEG